MLHDTSGPDVSLEWLVVRGGSLAMQSRPLERQSWSTFHDLLTTRPRRNSTLV